MSLAKVATLVGILGTAIPGGMYVHGYFAHRADLAELSQEFRVHAAEQQRDIIQQRIWQTEDRIQEVGPRPELVERKRELEDEKGKVERRIQQIQKEVK